MIVKHSVITVGLNHYLEITVTLCFQFGSTDQ